MADPLPVAPDEAVNRARVAAIAQGGMSAAQQVPGIATAPEAMQTAMARSAGINAPDAFNATQVGTIQNPFTRADSQLAADQGGAAGVLGSINSSTQDYLQKAAGGLDIQKEITRRAVQQLASQHEFDAQDLEIKKLEATARLADAKARNDPNSPAYQLAQMTAQNDLAEQRARKADLERPQNPATVSETSKMTGLPAGIINNFQSLPNYATWAGTAKELGKAGFTADQWASQAYLIAQQQKALGGADNPIKTDADVSALAHTLTAQFGQMFPNFSLASAGGPSAGPPVAAGAPAMALTAAPGGGTPGTMQGYNEALARLAAPPTAPTNPAQAMWSQARAPIAPGPTVLTPAQQAQIAALQATQESPPPMVMDNTDAKKLARALAESTKKKGKK